MKTTLFLSLLTVLFFNTWMANSQSYDLRFETDIVGCEWCYTVEMRTADVDFNLGAMSYVFSYDDNALAISSATSINFDENSTSCTGQNNVFIAPQPVLTTPGQVSNGVNPTTAIISGFDSCPIISTGWVPIDQYCFTVLDPTSTASLVWSQNPTQHFATTSQDVSQMVAPATFFNTDDPLNLPCIPTVGQWGFICLALMFSATGLVALRREERAGETAKG